jgi:hypothetical protein
VRQLRKQFHLTVSKDRRFAGIVSIKGLNLQAKDDEFLPHVEYKDLDYFTMSIRTALPQLAFRPTSVY